MGLVIILTILIVLFFSVSRIFPLFLSWYLERKYRIPITIRRIGLPYLKLCYITISKNEYTIQIKEIGIKSSFLNSELTKLITLVVKDVRIIKRMPANKFSNGFSLENQRNILDFRGKKVPHFINSFAQFMAVHVYNISTMLIQPETECLLQILTKELHIDGSILKNAKSLLVTLNITDANVTVLKIANNQAKTKLAKFSFGITMETALVAQGPLSVEKLDVKMSHSRALIRSEFYSLFHSSKRNEAEMQDKPVEPLKPKLPNISEKKNWSYKKGETMIFESKSFIELHAKKETDNVSEKENEDVLERILPIVPKNFSLYIDDTSFNGFSEKGNIEYNASLKSMAMNYRSVSQNETNGVLFNFYLNNLMLVNDTEKTLDLKNLSIDAKVSKCF